MRSMKLGVAAHRIATPPCYHSSLFTTDGGTDRTPRVSWELCGLKAAAGVVSVIT